MTNDKDIDTLLNKLLITFCKNNNFEQACQKIYALISKMSYYCKMVINVQSTEKNSYEDFIDRMIKKMVMDFYVYNLFRKENNEKITEEEERIFSKISNLNNENEIVNKFLLNRDLNVVIKDYYLFHLEDDCFIKKAIANTINTGHYEEIFKLYTNFYNNYEDYSKYIINEKIIKGLLFVEQYENDQTLEFIKKFIHNEFDDTVLKNQFISYVLSNVYAYIKENNITGEQIDKWVMLTEKLTFRMYCFYDNEELLDYLFKTYFELYKGKKWFNFNDIRNNSKGNSIDTIKQLDRDFTHPKKHIEEATDVSTIVSFVEDDIINYLTMLLNNGYDETKVIDDFKKVVIGTKVIPNSSNLSKIDFILNLRLLIVSKYYEYINLKYNEVEINYQDLFDKIDDDMDVMGALELFNDENNVIELCEKYFEYLFQSYKTDYEARYKIINDNKLLKLLKFNPNMLLEYRKMFGYMFSTESLETVDLTNDLISVINNIIAVNLQANVCSQDRIYSEIAQVIKYSCDDYQFSLEEMIGYFISNIYERLKLKKSLTDAEEDFISKVEDDYFEIDEIIDDDKELEKLIVMFKSLNNCYLDFEQMCKIRKNTRKKGNIKVLEKFDPNYYVDKACLEK